MNRWIKICRVSEVPKPGNVMEAEADGIAVCLANLNGELSALDNLCPHRQGPLGQGWIEGEAVMCPWHGWAFDLRTGQADFPENEKVDVFPVKIVDDDVLVQIDASSRTSITSAT